MKQSVSRGGVLCSLRVLVVHDIQNVSSILGLIIVIAKNEERRTKNEQRKKKEERVAHCTFHLCWIQHLKKTMRRQNNNPSQRRNQQPWNEKVQKLMLNVVTVSIVSYIAPSISGESNIWKNNEGAKQKTITKKKTTTVKGESAKIKSGKMHATNGRLYICEWTHHFDERMTHCQFFCQSHTYLLWTAKTDHNQC